MRIFPTLTKHLLTFVLLAAAGTLSAQTSYIVEQLGRDAHHIVQSLGAFVGNERAESQQFDITYMPSGNRVEGVMIINTADCYEVILDVRSADFLRDFNRLFQVYHTENPDSDDKTMHFGDKLVRVRETSSTTSRFRSFTLTEKIL